LKEFEFIKLFRKVFKKEDNRHYIFYLPYEEELQETTIGEFMIIHDLQGKIKINYQVMKQIWRICRFMVRDT